MDTNTTFELEGDQKISSEDVKQQINEFLKANDEIDELLLAQLEEMRDFI